MNARYYLPQIGRFVSPDTMVPEPGNPQSYNRYSYAFNNPTNLIDLSGHSPGDWWEYLQAQLRAAIETQTIHSPSPRSLPTLSVAQQEQVDILNTTTVAADIVALGLSGGGAVTEVGLALVDTMSPLGDAAGLGLYYEFINPVEDIASLIGFGATFAGDALEGLNYIQLTPLEIGIGQDTLVSMTGIALGNLLPLEGILDTAVNIPLVWYDVQGAAGNITTYIEFRWNEDRGWYFIIYPTDQGIVDEQ